MDSQQQHEAPEFENEFVVIYNTEGAQPYSFEPAARRNEDRQNGGNLNGERRAIEMWELQNAHRLGNANWCRCGHCGPMDSIIHSVCCQELEPFRELFLSLDPPVPRLLCVTGHPGFEGCCLNPFVLMLAYQAFREQHGPLHLQFNEQYRYVAYRQMIRWTHGIIGRHIRKPLPSCVVNAIRAAFPDEAGHYKGFQWPSLD